jgi:hypothetical protein
VIDDGDADDASGGHELRGRHDVLGAGRRVAAYAESLTGSIALQSVRQHRIG